MPTSVLLAGHEVERWVRPERLSAVVADRRHLVRTAMGTLLRHLAHITVLDEATTTAETLHLVSTTAPDFLLISAELAEAAIHDILRHAHAKSPNTRIWVLSEDVRLREGVVAAIRRGGHAVADWNAPAEKLIDELRRQTRLILASRHSGPRPKTLSNRELEVLQLVGDGLSNRQIAARLTISGGTVKRHLANIFDRLQVHSRVQAVNEATVAGLLKPRALRSRWPEVG